ncbi:MAG: carboxymuconolactone decarboxylase family protein [Planctomycetota bacterium]
MTPRIPALADAAAPAPSREILDATRRAIGMVPNLHRTLAHAPAALLGYTQLAKALAEGDLEPRLREHIAVGTAALNGCGYCASAHTAIGKGAGIAGDELARNLHGKSDDPKVEAVLDFAREYVESRGAVADAAIERLVEAGFDDAAIVEIAAHVGLNFFTNAFNNLARTVIDFPVVTLPRA